MLTKNLINVRRRGDRIYPQFISLSDEIIAADAYQVWSAFQNSAGKTLSEVKGLFDYEAMHQKSYGPGLIKLCEDRCHFQEPSESAQKLRWDIFDLAESLRGEATSSQDLIQKIASSLQLEVHDIQMMLYSDLPTRREVIKIPSDSMELLVERYNCGQVQALLFDAEHLRVEIKHPETVLKRRLLQAIRFHGLCIRIQESSAERLIIDVEGPLSIFQQSQSYGLKLASFFPHILLSRSWSIESKVKTKQRRMCVLKLDEKSGLSARFLRGAGHMPEEYVTLVQRWERLANPEWSMGVSDQLLQLAHGEVAVPDFCFTDKKGNSVHVELFHRWHRSGLLERLKTLQEHDELPLILGVHKKLAREVELEHVIAKAPNLLVRVFEFRDFPTTKDLKQAVFAWQR